MEVPDENVGLLTKHYLMHWQVRGLKDSVSDNISLLLPYLQTILVLDKDSSTVIGRTCHVTSPIWSRIDWLTGPKIRIVGFSFVQLEMDKTVHSELYLLLSGRSKHQFQ